MEEHPLSPAVQSPMTYPERAMDDQLARERGHHDGRPDGREEGHKELRLLVGVRQDQPVRHVLRDEDTEKRR